MRRTRVTVKAGEVAEADGRWDSQWQENRNYLESRRSIPALKLLEPSYCVRMSTLVIETETDLTLLETNSTDSILKFHNSILRS